MKIFGFSKLTSKIITSILLVGLLLFLGISLVMDGGVSTSSESYKSPEMAELELQRKRLLFEKTYLSEYSEQLQADIADLQKAKNAFSATPITPSPSPTPLLPTANPTKETVLGVERVINNQINFYYIKKKKYPELYSNRSSVKIDVNMKANSVYFYGAAIEAESATGINFEMFGMKMIRKENCTGAILEQYEYEFTYIDGVFNICD